MSPSRPSASDRAARRRAARGVPGDVAGLRARVEVARLPGTPEPVAERARKMLLAWLDTAIAHDLPFREVVGALSEGMAAERIASIDLAGQAQAADHAACRKGCAFCCILPGVERGTITGHEARRLHAALAPQAGKPDGRAWHADACPSLDPESLTCRAYEARPMICRSYFSTDVTACQEALGGANVPGTWVLGAHPVYLAVQSFARAAVKGLSQAPTYSLAGVAAAAVDGRPLAAALKTARQAPKVLERERKRISASL